MAMTRIAADMAIVACLFTVGCCAAPSSAPVARPFDGLVSSIRVRGYLYDPRSDIRISPEALYEIEQVWRFRQQEPGLSQAELDRQNFEVRVSSEGVPTAEFGKVVAVELMPYLRPDDPGTYLGRWRTYLVRRSDFKVIRILDEWRKVLWEGR